MTNKLWELSSLSMFEHIWAIFVKLEHVWANSNKIELECQANHQKERMIVICKVHQNFRLQMSYYLELKTTIFKVCSEASSHQIHQMLISTFVWFVVPKDIFCVCVSTSPTVKLSWLQVMPLRRKIIKVPGIDFGFLYKKCQNFTFNKIQESKLSKIFH